MPQYNNDAVQPSNTEAWLLETNFIIKPDEPIPDEIFEETLNRVKNGDILKCRGPGIKPGAGALANPPIKPGTVFLEVYVSRFSDHDEIMFIAKEYLEREKTKPGSGGPHHWYLYKG